MKKRSPLEANIANSKVQQNMSSSPISIAFMTGSGITIGWACFANGPIGSAGGDRLELCGTDRRKRLKTCVRFPNKPHEDKVKC